MTGAKLSSAENVDIIDKLRTDNSEHNLWET
jgi:hypothetical protein